MMAVLRVHLLMEEGVEDKRNADDELMVVAARIRSFRMPTVRPAQAQFVNRLSVVICANDEELCSRCL